MAPQPITNAPNFLKYRPLSIAISYKICRRVNPQLTPSSSDKRNDSTNNNNNNNNKSDSNNNDSSITNKSCNENVSRTTFYIRGICKLEHGRMLLHFVYRIFGTLRHILYYKLMGNKILSGDNHDDGSGGSCRVMVNKDNDDDDDNEEEEKENDKEDDDNDDEDYDDDNTIVSIGSRTSHTSSIVSTVRRGVDVNGRKVSSLSPTRRGTRDRFYSLDESSVGSSSFPLLVDYHSSDSRGDGDTDSPLSPAEATQRKNVHGKTMDEGILSSKTFKRQGRRPWTRTRKVKVVLRKSETEKASPSLINCIDDGRGKGFPPLSPQGCYSTFQRLDGSNNEKGKLSINKSRKSISIVAGEGRRIVEDVVTHPHEKRIQNNTSQSNKQRIEFTSGFFPSVVTSVPPNNHQGRLPLLPLIPSSSIVLTSQVKEINGASEDLNFFDAPSNRATLRRMNRDLPLPDRRGYILGEDLLRNPGVDTPLLVFVNSRSGSKQGLVLRDQLRGLLNPVQVWDLADDGDPSLPLKSFTEAFTSRLKVLVCGGDGTVSWIMSALDKLSLERKWPPIAILPLGTGNDLAWVHGWGGGYANEPLPLILERVQESYTSLLDRWQLSIVSPSGKKRGKNSTKRRMKKVEMKKKIISFTNYMSIGADALTCLQVHNLRENSPLLFFSRVLNKAWYTLFGVGDGIKASGAGLSRIVTLKADGKVVPIPQDSQGIVFLNIDSYMGNVPLWSNSVPLQYSTNDNNISPILSGKKGKGSRSQSHGDLFRIFSKNARDSVGTTRVDEGRDDWDIDQKLRSDSFNGSRETGFDTEKRPSSCQDGMIDIVSFRGIFHLGQIRVGVGKAQRLCQCRGAAVTLSKTIAVQVDGEPWKQEKCKLVIGKMLEPAVMLHRSKDGVETEMSKLLDWAVEGDIIDGSAHSALMKEFSLRIESKTRARKVRSQDNLLYNVTNALSGTYISSF